MTHLLVTYPTKIASVLLCGLFQLQFLAGQGKIELREASREQLTPDDCGWADVVYFIRSDCPEDIAVAKACKQAGKRIVYVMDDDLLDLPDYVSASGYYRQKKVRNSIWEFLKLCDVFVSPSEKLGKKYGGRKTLFVEEPSPPHADKTPRTEGPLRIGFAGSIDRTPDVDALLGPVIGSLLERYGDAITVEFFGIHPQAAERYHLRWIPYSDSYEAYQNKMSELDWDIGLAPMPDTAFNACKHYNKFIEYAGCGIAGVYSDVQPYTRIIRDGENGLLCANTAEAWRAAITRLIDDAALRAEIAADAQQQARRQLSVEATALALEKALGALLTYSAPHHRPPVLTQPPRKEPSTRGIAFQARRLAAAVRRYGLRLPGAAVHKLREKIQNGRAG